MNISIKHNLINRILWLVMTIILVSNFTFSKYVYAISEKEEVAETEKTTDESEIIGDEEIGDEATEDDKATVRGGKKKAKETADKAKTHLTDMLESFDSVMGTDEEAKELSSQGGDLFTPITDFVVAIADNVIGTLQSVALQNNKLSNLITGAAIKVKVEDTDTKLDNFSPFYVYMIKYSPAAIFSGNIPSLDINFFQETKTDSTKVDVKTTEFEFDLVR